MMWADDSFAQREVAGEAESSKALYYIPSIQLYTIYSYIAILYTTNQAEPRGGSANGLKLLSSH